MVVYNRRIGGMIKYYFNVTYYHLNEKRRDNQSNKFLLKRFRISQWYIPQIYIAIDLLCCSQKSPFLKRQHALTRRPDTVLPYPHRWARILGLRHNTRIQGRRARADWADRARRSTSRGHSLCTRRSRAGLKKRKCDQINCINIYWEKVSNKGKAFEIHYKLIGAIS